MKIAVIGLGAMGSIYAALLADAGNEVWAMDPWTEHTTAIRENGLRVQGASGERTVRALNITHNPHDLHGIELFIVATKARHVGDAAQMIRPLMTPGALVLTIQNGLGSGERIAQHLPEQSVLLGVAEGFGASVSAPGHVQHTSMKMIRIGAYVAGNNKALSDITDIWTDAGFNTQTFDDIAQLIWEKFICNVAFSAPCTVFEKSVRELTEDPHGHAVSQACALEAYNVAVAKKVNLSFGNPLDYIADFAKRVGNAKPSLYLDHLARRPSEIDAINGMVPVVAREVGLTAPYNDALTHILSARETGWQSSAGSQSGESQ
ncbi:MAG: 2-dehydropantoate 2-reductase [Pseudomonadota bacterium]